MSTKLNRVFVFKKLPGIYEVILVRTPSNGGHMEFQLAVSCYQAGLPVVGLGCIWLGCWPVRGSCESPQTTKADARIEDCP